ncbi:MAG: tyrosine-type recombinase/integrase [Phototrophicaceae bacterium]
MTHPDLLTDYEKTLASKAESTAQMYLHILRHFIGWMAQLPGAEEQFAPDRLTRTAIEVYMEKLKAEQYSESYRTLVKAAISGFAQWLMAQNQLHRNPTDGIRIAARPLMAPRVLSEDQRYVLRDLVERQHDLRGAAIFALGYWAGCRVSDVSWLTVANTDLTARRGWLKVGYKGDKWRVIDLLNQARKPLYEYWHSENRQKVNSPYMFLSQRGQRLTEAGIHHWLRTLKTQATKAEWEMIQDVSFHDLRHDFAHRARELGWTLEELAFYLGHITRQGLPAIQTTARYTQASRESIKSKLKRFEK